LKNFAFVGVVVMAVLCAACGDGGGVGTIDTSSDESLKNSVDAMSKSMSDAEKKEFGEHLHIVILKGTLDIMEDPETAKGMTEKEVHAAVKRTIHGKSLEDIRAAATRIMTELKAKDTDDAVKKLMLKAIGGRAPAL